MLAVTLYLPLHKVVENPDKNGLLRVPWAEGHVLNTSVLLFIPSRMIHRLRVLKLNLRQL